MSTLNCELIKNASFDSSVTFPAGHIIQTKYYSNDDTSTTWTTGWKTLVGGTFTMSNASNALIIHCNVYAGKSISATALYGRVAYKSPDASGIYGSDGQIIPEGVSSFDESLSTWPNVQRVHHIAGDNIYSNGDLVQSMTWFLYHLPGTTDEIVYQAQLRGRTDNTNTFRTNACTTITNGGYEVFMTSRMTIQEVVV